ncbi:glycoside hydrolase family 16 protein [Dietzia sp. B32]|uniref:glycoside hydrolase family 16 protein n=1 Tax=Dietzia sp. B32 TaxID=2915130 RepID=UPI0021ADD315|nr:glycoside hydrolase family 16 protein [Dietzia sp. B32]UVE94089.1 glycoside hydrolase family 16 protein [Dietzia sp. B32]
MTSATAVPVLVALAAASACSVDVHLGENRVVPQTARPIPPPDEGVRPQGVAMNDAPLILDEEFDGTGLDTGVWNTCHWWDNGGCTIATNNELEWYLPGQVRVADGTLRLTAEQRRVVGAEGRTFPYVSGMVSTGPPRYGAEPKVAFTYGTVEVRFRAPIGAGLWPAIWMLPANQESKPEIDIFEAVGQRPGQATIYFHPDPELNLPASHTLVQLPPGVDIADTHTVRLHWSPNRLEFFFDGEKAWEVTGEQVPDEPMYLVINLAVGGDFGGQPDQSATPATFEIDYARIWSGGAP